MLPLSTVVLVARADETSATSVHTRYNIIRFWRSVVAGMGSCECGLRLAPVIFRVVSLAHLAPRYHKFACSEIWRH